MSKEFSSSYCPTAEEARKARGWVVIDAAGLPVGRVASQVAAILRGKNKATFTPHTDTGDFVVVINAAKVVLTGGKPDKKLYRHYTTYIGGLKTIKARDLLDQNPVRLFTRAVKGMLPRGPLGFQQLTKLKVYAGAEHPHSAQKPQQYSITREMIF